MSHKVAIGISIGVVLVGGFVVLCTWGLSMYKDEVCDHLKAQAAITERLGLLTSCEARAGATIEIEDMDTFVFALEGTKAVGRAYVRSTFDDDGNEVYLGTLLVVGNEEILVEGERPPTK